MSECPTCRRETDGLNYVTGPYCSVGCHEAAGLLEEVTSRAEAAERECDEARAEAERMDVWWGRREAALERRADAAEAWAGAWKAKARKVIGQRNHFCDQAQRFWEYFNERDADAEKAWAEVERLLAITGSPDTYEALLYQNQEQALEIANLKRGIEAYREDGRWHLRCRDEGKPFHCKVCDWEHEQKEADRA